MYLAPQIAGNHIFEDLTNFKFPRGAYPLSHLVRQHWFEDLCVFSACDALCITGIKVVDYDDEFQFLGCIYTTFAAWGRFL